MKKSLIAASLFVAATAAHAGPYVGLGIQGTSAKLESSSLRDPVVDGEALDLSGSHEKVGVRLLGGYSFSDTWALELGFQQMKIEDSIEVRDVGQDEEWEAEVDGMLLTLAPVYSLRLNDSTALRLTAGLVYGDHDIKQSHGIDVENGPDQELSSAKDGKSRFGGLAGIGVTYRTPWKVEVLADAQYLRSSVVSGPSMTLGVLYRF